MHFVQIFLALSGIFIFGMTWNIARKERFDALHFLVFFSIGTGLLVFSFFPQIFIALEHFFGIENYGRYVLLYASIIFLVYFVLLLFRKTESNRKEISHIVRVLAIQQARPPSQLK